MTAPEREQPSENWNAVQYTLVNEQGIVVHVRRVETFEGVFWIIDTGEPEQIVIGSNGMERRKKLYSSLRRAQLAAENLNEARARIKDQKRLLEEELEAELDSTVHENHVHIEPDGVTQ